MKSFLRTAINIYKDPRLRIITAFGIFFIGEYYTLGKGNFFLGFLVAVFVAVLLKFLGKCPNCKNNIAQNNGGLWLLVLFRRNCPHCSYDYIRGEIRN